MTVKTLPPFAYRWVGGDIWGLVNFQDACGRVARRLSETDRALAHQVASVVDAGDWQGGAADAFTAAWDTDSKTGALLADTWTRIGTIAGNLAAELAVLENALEVAADQAEKRGLAIDQATGRPLPDDAASGGACLAPQAAAAHGRLAAEYSAYREQILGRASVARANAAAALNAITAALLPPLTDWGDVANGLDTARSIKAIPTTLGRGLRKELAKAEAEKAAVTNEQWEAAIDGRKVSGNNYRMEGDLVAKGTQARQEVARLEGKLASSPPEDLSSMVADGNAEGLGLSGVLGGVVQAVPFAGTAAGAGVTIWQDREEGESWGHAIGDGVVSNGTALGTGMGIAAVIGTGTVGSVAAGAVGGSLAAIGVGDFVHQVFQENWTQDWQQRGVLHGTIHGTIDSLDHTRHDLAHLWDDITPL